MLRVMDDITPFPALEASESRAIWQLDQPLDADSTAVPQFIVEKDTSTRYVLTFRERNVDRQEWVGVWAGDLFRDTKEPRMGQGSFEIDYTAAAQADPISARRGQVQISYSANSGEDLSLTYRFENYLGENDAGSEPRNMIYEFCERTNGSGYFNFESYFNWSGKTDALEKLGVKTLWTSVNTGQSQVLITGADIEAQGLDVVELRECWDAAFIQTYYVQLYYWKTPPETGNPTKDKEEGDATACPTAFEPPDLSGDETPEEGE
ncbi:MAG: hypothetical protein C4523_17635 [Myxococcales bacterium]|nr:MAG: hypothetical protein C4523_17635 [Myxococcales bacterium]